MGLDMYLPVVPQMTDVFSTSPALVHLTLSLFLLVTGVGQLFIGPLADRFGRHPICYGAAALYALGALVSGLSASIGVLIMARVITAFGACGMFVAAFAIVRDLYASEESARMYSFLNGTIGVSPCFAPILGGYMGAYFGWQSNFYFLAGIGVLALALTHWALQETLPARNRVKIDRAVFRRYLDIAVHPQFAIYATLAGLAEGVFFCFFSISPFLTAKLGVSMTMFGYYFAIFGSVIGLGGLASGKLLHYIGRRATVELGIAMISIGGVAMLAWHYAAGLTLVGLLLPMTIACTGAIFLVGCAASAALEPFEAIAGTASAAFGSMQFGLSALIGAFLMVFPVNSTVPYGIAVVLTAAVSISLMLVERWRLPTLRATARLD